MSETPDDVVIPAGALASSPVRVDTWLWATRQLKSRSQATAAVRAGHVRVNGEPVKAAYKVRVGDEVRLRIEGFDRILGVVLLLAKRVSYPQARTAYDGSVAAQAGSSHPGTLRNAGLSLSPVHRATLRSGEGGATRGLGDRTGLNVVEPVELGLEVEDVTLKNELPRELTLIGRSLQAGHIAQGAQGRATLGLDRSRTR